MVYSDRSRLCARAGIDAERKLSLTAGYSVFNWLAHNSDQVERLLEVRHELLGAPLAPERLQYT